MVNIDKCGVVSLFANYSRCPQLYKIFYYLEMDNWTFPDIEMFILCLWKSEPIVSSKFDNSFDSFIFESFQY